MVLEKGLNPGVAAAAGPAIAAEAAAAPGRWLRFDAVAVPLLSTAPSVAARPSVAATPSVAARPVPRTRPVVNRDKEISFLSVPEAAVRPGPEPFRPSQSGSWKASRAVLCPGAPKACST